MRPTRLLLVLVLALVAGCGRHPESSAAPAAADKIEGPAIKSLSHGELMAVLHECHQYGSSDDPKVKYTTRYCSAAQSAHAMEGYAPPSGVPFESTPSLPRKP